MKVVTSEDIRAWSARTERVTDIVRSIGRMPVERDYLEQVLGMPSHLSFVLEKLAEERGRELSPQSLDSIPFHSLCAGLLLPLSSMAPEKAASLFGVAAPILPAAGREALVIELFQKEIGLSIPQKICAVLGDPFLGKPSTFRRDSLLRLLMSVELVGWKDLLDRLAAAGDVAILFARTRPARPPGPPLSAAEVLETLRLMTQAGRTLKLTLLRSLLLRSTKLESYFLARLLLKRAGLGADYQGPILPRALGVRFGAGEEQIAHAMAVSDVFHVARVLLAEGPEGLRSIELQPLVAVRPALASGSTHAIRKLPVWVERKYDGIRLMLHKSTDRAGAVLSAAYTRGRSDWLELIPGLDATIRVLPAHSVIVDGELYATRLEFGAARPATVYELYAALQGEQKIPLTIRYAAFDLLYLNGLDLTALPLAERRKRLSHLFAPLGATALPIPLSLSDGQLATTKDDVNRLYHHFRAQGHEGIVAKDLEGPYRLAERDPSWLKRKPEITLDLVLLGAVFAVTAKESAGVFGSYVLGARTERDGFIDVGDVAGVDRVSDAQIRAEILRGGLATGRRIERGSASGARPGIELVPALVVTVKFEGIVRDSTTRRLTLRAPRILAIRADKPASEADTLQAIEQIELRQRVG